MSGSTEVRKGGPTRDVRDDFPLLARRIGGKRIVYLDSAATTQKPRRVLDAMTRFYEEHNANIHRGIYTLSEEATTAYEEARATVAGFINAPPSRLVFTSGATESISLVANGLSFLLEPGDEILLTPQEHHANIVPWQQAAARTGAKLVYCDLAPDLAIDITDLQRRITPRTKILAITHASNVLGTVTPLDGIIPFAKERGVLVVVDGAQAVAHLPVDVQALGCDAYAFSAHKLFGPMGTGALYLSDTLMDLSPLRFGGDMIDDVTEQGAEFARGEPRRFEAGTPNVAGAVGFAEAIRYLQGLDRAKELERELSLFTKAWNELSVIDGVTLYGPAPAAAGESDGTVIRLPILAFSLAGVHPHDVAQILSDEGVSIRSGKHCAHPLHARMGVEATSRASFARYSTAADVDSLVAAVRKAQEVFR